MTQLHFSVDPATAERLGREAKARGLSLSQYLATIIRRELPETWPEGYLASVVGSCTGSGLREPTELTIDDVEI